MPFVQQVYSVTSPQEFIELVTMCDYIVSTQDPESKIAIVKATNKSNTDVRPPVKGLIFNLDSGEIVAPAIYAPVDVAVSSDIPASPIGYSQALDGILIRIYRWNNKVHWSTSGMFNPTDGKWGSNKTFGSMFNDCAGQVNFDAIKEGLCYYAIMEHSDHMSFYKPNDTYALLTLVRVTDSAGVIQNIRDLTAHADAFTNILEVKATCLDLTLFDTDMPACPVTYDMFGIMAHYEAGNMVRLLSLQTRKAMSIAPNMPFVWKHWINCVWTGGYPMIDLYLTYFPWHKPIFDNYTFKLRSKFGHDLSSVTKKTLRELIEEVGEAPAVQMEPSAIQMEPSAIQMEPSAIQMEPSAIQMEPSAIQPEPSAIQMEAPAVHEVEVDASFVEVPSAEPVKQETITTEPVPQINTEPVPIQRHANLTDLKENCIIG